jgi:hypothetical protein
VNRVRRIALRHQAATPCGPELEIFDNFRNVVTND